MENETLAQGASGDGTHNASQAPKGTEQNQTQSGFDKDVIDELRRGINSANAEIRRLREGYSPKAPKQESTVEKTLNQRIEAMEAREKRIADKERMQSIRQSAEEAGVAPDRLDVYVDHVLARHGAKIVHQDNETTWQDELDQPKGLSDLAKKILSGPNGAMFKTAANVPAARGLRANARAMANVPKAYGDIPQAERLKMTREQRRQAAIESMSQE